MMKTKWAHFETASPGRQLHEGENVAGETPSTATGTVAQPKRRHAAAGGGEGMGNGFSGESILLTLLILLLGLETGFFHFGFEKHDFGAD